MALPILKGLLRGYVNSLFDEGLVNDQFNQTMALNRTGGPDCAVNLIERYFDEAERILSELSCHIYNPRADFCKLASLARELEAGSTSVGAEHMRLACSDLIKACDEKNPTKFAQIHPLVYNEFTNTRKKLASFVQMERRINRLESAESSNSN